MYYMFNHHTLNKYTNKCICCNNSPKVHLEIKYSLLPFRYIHYIKSHIFFVNVCYYCYLSSRKNKHLYYNIHESNNILNKILINSIELLDEFIKV